MPMTIHRRLVNWYLRTPLELQGQIELDNSEIYPRGTVIEAHNVKKFNENDDYLTYIEVVLCSETTINIYYILNKKDEKKVS